jgi:hypothetical protein
MCIAQTSGSHERTERSFRVARDRTESGPDCDLTGVLGLARVPIKLFLEIGLGVDGSTECAHRDLEFPAAKCADCDDRGRAKPLHDSKIALFRRVVLLNHRI